MGDSSGGGSEKSHYIGFHCWYCRQSGEWQARDCQETCSGPWRVSQNDSCHSHKDLQLWKKSARWTTKRLHLGWRRSDSGRVRRPKWWLMLFPDNLRQHSRCYELAEGKKRVGQRYSRSGGLLERLGWGYKKEHGGKLCQGAPAVIRALPGVCDDRQRPYWQKLKIQNVLTITCFLLLWFSGNPVFTPCILLTSILVICLNSYNIKTQLQAKGRGLGL